MTVDALAAELDVSRMTVHRDLDELQKSGVLRKVRGGASAQRSATFESDLPYRMRTALAEKRAIARAAAELAGEGDVVIIDDSTSAMEVLPHLGGRVPMTIITNFMPVMEALTDNPDMTLIGLGASTCRAIERFSVSGARNRCLSCTRMCCSPRPLLCAD